MGFKGAELEFRAHDFLAYHGGKCVIYVPEPARDSDERLKCAEEFFATPCLQGATRVPEEAEAFN